MKNPTIIKDLKKAEKKEIKKILKQMEFELNDKRKEINLDEEMENLNKLRRKERNKRRKNNEQKH